MKKLLLLFVTVIMSFNVHAQNKLDGHWFAGGTAGVAYSDETFSMLIMPQGGYEFNDKWAAGLGVGCYCVDEDFFAEVNPYIRYTVKKFEKFAVDAKLSALGLYGYRAITEVGIGPSARFFISDKWTVSADCGLVGVSINDGNIDPLFSVKTSNVTMSLLYRF